MPKTNKPKKAVKKTVKKVVKKVTKPKVSYTASIKVMGRVFKGTGDSVSDAIANIKPGAVAGRVIMTVTSPNNKKERVLPLVVSKRLFMSKGMTQEVALKNVSLMFNGV